VAQPGQSDSPKQAFKDAAQQLVQAGDQDDLAALITAYQNDPTSAKDPWLAYDKAQLLILGKQYKQAEAMLKPLADQADANGPDDFANAYYFSAGIAGDGMAAYTTATDKLAAFKGVAAGLLARSDNAVLAHFCDTQAASYPSDPWIYYYQARMHEAVEEYDAADASYDKAMSLAGVKDIDAIRSARVAARFSAGDGLSAYKEIEPRDQVFTQLCGLFTDKKDVTSLARLVSTRQADAPQDPTLPLWNAAAKFLAGNYAAAVKLLDANRSTLAAVNRGRFTDLYVRSEVRLKNFDAALAEASRPTGTTKDWLHLAVVQCAKGDVDAATAALNAVLKTGGRGVGDLYLDPDIGPALATAPFAGWAQQHPAPPPRPATS
jgi:hypothetical protein